MMSESPQIYLWAFVFLSNRINDMLIVLLSLFSGINFALAILSFFIVSKNRSQKIYLYFGIFSLFSGLYFLFMAISETTGTNQMWIVLLCAAIYYGVFPFFLFELIGAKHKVVSWLTSSIFLIAYIVFFTEPVASYFSIWQIL